MEQKRDLIGTVLHTASTLLPVNDETRLLIAWLDEPGQTARLQRLAVETGADDPVESFIEAIELVLDAGEIPVSDDKRTRHQINWDHVEKHLRKRSVLVP